MNWKSRGTWTTIIVSSVIAWLLTHLLDATALGVPRLLSKIVYVITLGSAKVRDAPYASAALNPYPVIDLVLLQILTLFPPLTVGTISGFKFGKYREKLSRARKATLPAGESSSNETTTPERSFQLALSFVALLIIMSGIAVPFSILNNAVLARRIFEADRDIVAPFLRSQEIVEIQSDFAKVSTKAQYEAVIKRLSVVAQNNNVRLRPEHL